MKLLKYIVISTFFVLSLGALAQTAELSTAADAPHAAPCQSHQRFREFDFWVGDWEVRGADGTIQGENTISAEERGCVLVERWRGVQGSTGLSINYLDRVTDEWVPSRHAASGYQINIRGGMTDDGMLLRGTIHYIGTGQTAPFRGLWTPLPDGRVRQYFEQSNDDGETWQPWFEGFYARKSAD